MTKYHAKKVVIDGHKFDSKLESERYLYLKELMNRNIIKDLELQPKYELIPSFKKNGKTYRKTTYVADFKYYNNDLGKEIIEDVKGMETQAFKIKHKLFEYMYPNYELEIVKKWKKNL